MNPKLKILFLLSILILCCCASTKKNEDISISRIDISKFKDSILNDSTFINVKDVSNDFVFDMKYATNNNFLNEQVYECDECYLRYITIKNLIEANKEFVKLGYRIKFFDCYRPIDVQKKMWKIVSNPIYVADPAKGSIHNRGAAVDITLVDVNGKELNMGTEFDFFGEKASHNYKKLPTKVQKNRNLLKQIMLKNHFKSFDSEWWHYNLENSSTFPISNFKWNCN
jgi:D-alanyl-D-alanine dipeptidase